MTSAIAGAAPPPTAGTEWKRNWPLVAAATWGIALSTVAVFSLGMFMQPLENEFGWSRTEISTGASFAAFVSFAIAGFLGRLVDRVNVRHVAVFGILVCALALAGFSLAGSLTVWLALWAVFAVGAMMISPIVWLPGINGAFKSGRDLPMAIALCGPGFGSAIAPIAAQFLIDGYGWRMAFQLLALLWGGSALLLTLLFFFDRRERGGAAAAGAAEAPASTPVRALLASAAFIKLALAIFGTIMVMTAVVLNLAPLLIDGGLDRSQAARMAGLAGIGTIVGTPLAGWLYGHVRSSVVTTGAMACMALSCILLQYPGWQLGVVVGCLAMGTSGGGIMSVMASATASVFKPQDFGTVYGSLTSVMALSSIAGPVGAGLVRDGFGSYDPLLWAGCAIALGSAALLATLRADN